MSDGCKLPNYATPGRPGNLKCKCLLWANCPLYERIRQDQSFVFSPETIQYASQSLRNKLSFINGVDGLFLRPRPNFYLHNFLAFPKRDYKAEPDDLITKLKKAIGLESSVAPLKSLEFLALNNNLIANSLVLDGGSAVSSTAIGSHQTWIADGSLYCSENILPSEYDSVQGSTIGETAEKGITTVTRSFCTTWQYVSENVGQSITVLSQAPDQTGSVFNDPNEITEARTNNIFVPMTKGVDKPGDPIQAMTEHGLQNHAYFKHADGVYKNINPGMHWRVLKRTPLFQGEDFTVEFIRKAFQSTNIGSKSVKYRMLNKFAALDVFAVPEGPVCGSLNADGLWDKGKNNEILENTRKVLDFSRQQYYMVELGVGDPNHNYVLIIAENSFPIFCHIGKTPYLECNLQQFQSSGPTASPPPAKSTSSDIKKCSDDTGSGGDVQYSLREVTVVEYPKYPILRKLSTYDSASSLTLLKQDKLRITVRQHGGDIVITFSNHENNPWVISRKDLSANALPAGQPITESQVSYDSVRMLISPSQIALMGGNLKCGFTFAPLIYESLQSYTLPQNFSVEGPVDVDEIQFLWRDKGKSLNPEVSIKTPKSHYTNEAGSYSERAVNVAKTASTAVETVRTYAIDVQPEFVKKYGKAPDMMKNSKAAKSGIYESAIYLDSSQCTNSAGSTAETSKLMQVAISVVPGGYLFPAVDGGSPWPLKDCVTPLLYFFRMYVPPKGCIFDKAPIDVSQHVLTFSDEWSETDWQQIEHCGSISFLISNGMHFSGNQSNYLSTLIDKAFYLQISLWWEGGIMPTPDDPRDRVVFTGFCPGGTITTETNKKCLDCKLYDYSKIVKEGRFFNSPFFDRMRDVNAVQEILHLVGLRDGEENGSTTEPGSLVRILADADPLSEWYSFIFNGQKLFTREFALPGSYDILQSPFLKFPDNSSCWEAIEKISLLSNKVAYFDRLGVFNFVALPYDQELFGGQEGTEVSWDIQDWLALSKFDFFATPKSIVQPDNFSIGNQIIGDYKVERVVEDVVNEIKVISTSPNGEILIAGHVNYASLHNPDSPGFLGYHKPFVQMDGIFGNEATVKWMVKNYTRMFIPPIKVCFRAIGRNDIKALDVISFQPLGSTQMQPLIVSSVKSEIDASKNSWIQDFECLWLFPKQNIQWGASNEAALGLDGSISG